jgi:hypothetical protein
MNVKVDPEEDQRPEKCRDQSGTNLLDRMNVSPVMVRGSDHDTDAEIDQR